MVPRTAVVLFNLGGPESLETVEPFLFNLFNDRAILRLHQPLRWAVATLIAHRRAALALAIYRQIGGCSPLLAETEAQAKALEDRLGGEARVFVAMRYWHPMAAETAAAVAAFAPERLVLLPLYPQYSTTTTGSSLAAWKDAAGRVGLDVAAATICCYPDDDGLAAAHAAVIGEGLATAGDGARVLFSAHGLPERIVARGDPYVWQVERTVGAVRAALAADGREPDWRVCYQSRVGPLRWVGPSTEAMISEAGRDRVPVVLSPIAFVSEHSETLVELDIDYREKAERAGVPLYVRVPALGTHPRFIAALAEVVVRALARGPGAPCPAGGERLCPAGFAGCPAGCGG